ncbi:M24 family metallopeptidase [Bradyrhizobium zhanjiangense]|uniref:M24 family metallopeptidase n=1 Tax=Bradyrhizobium zhanjiangense TaxID=1325107 RepID=UPI00100901BB|nr:Xaa-Pro peptidase family protein [Bradyrhizobium zhanjiangense]
MSQATIPDQFVTADVWSDLRKYRQMPEIDMQRMYGYRVERIRGALRKAGASMCIFVNPISLRYAVDYRVWGLLQSHMPFTYLFVPVEGPIVIHGDYNPSKLTMVDECRKARAISFFNAGYELTGAARELANDVVSYLAEIGTDNRRVAVEYINPSVTQALLQRGLEVIDGIAISEEARLIKSADEISCMRWAIGVAELGIAKMKEAIRPGVTEVQLWGLLNYTNLANNGDWHDGRMLASGPRINPWFQEASQREVESGDLVGFDTDMIGPFGYFADISRTFHCGPAKPTKRQKELYGLAMKEIEYNLALVRPGITFHEFQQKALVLPEEYHPNAYTLSIHGCGMCDEYPRVNQVFGKPQPYEGTLEAGMVICVESYVGAVGERDGVKLEQQVLLVEGGYELLSTYPFEECLLD